MTRDELDRAFKEQALLTRREAMADLRAKVEALRVKYAGTPAIWAVEDVLALLDGDTQ